MVLYKKVDINKIKFLYWKKNLSLRKIATRLGLSMGRVRKEMVHNNIARRKTKKRELITIKKSVLKNLYNSKQYSLAQIAEKFGVAQSTVFRWMDRYNLSRRQMKYKKTPFSGNSNEEAYLLGMCIGDLYVHKHHRQISVALSTTHPAMMELFFKLFEKYGKPHYYSQYNKTTKRYGWKAYVLLDKSFEFLLSKTFDDLNSEQFYPFLAGFFDSEGCLHIYNNKGYIGLTTFVSNSDKVLLDKFLERLKSDGFNPRFHLTHKTGAKTTNDYYRKRDIWSLALHTNKDVIRLLELMPIKHKEKLHKFQIAKLAKEKNKWQDILEDVQKLRDSINLEVSNFVSEAMIKVGDKNQRSTIL